MVAKYGQSYLRIVPRGTLDGKHHKRGQGSQANFQVHPRALGLQLQINNEICVGRLGGASRHARRHLPGSDPLDRRCNPTRLTSRYWG